ncbi:MAG: BtpA/SgcQ family protein [Bacteroidales bacterium]|nr:BtpA/SgcQ family protein [Bacteroidales bacterium]
MKFKDIFPDPKPIIACIHLRALPGSPGYEGNMEDVIETALEETQIFNKYKLAGLIIENFRDMPFYPDLLPAETIASLAVVTREIVKSFHGPVGVNALRNDASAAMAIATTTGAAFIRVNVHTGASVTDQGIIQGKAHETLRLRASLKSNVLIFADVAVKHATPLGNRSIELETRDLTERGLADAIVVSGDMTGSEADPHKIAKVKENTSLPVLIGSGVNIHNLENHLRMSDGMIAGSTFKKDGKAINFVESQRVDEFLKKYQTFVH